MTEVGGGKSDQAPDERRHHQFTAHPRRREAFLWLLAAGQSPRQNCLANTQTGRMLTIITSGNPGPVHPVHRTISSCISLSRAWQLGSRTEALCQQ